MTRPTQVVRKYFLPPLLFAALALAGCYPLLVSSDGSEELHRYYAVYPDSGDGDAAMIMDEVYDWSCGGSMGRCYDRERNHRFSIYRASMSDSLKRDTMVALDSGRAVSGSYGSSLFWSARRNRLIYPAPSISYGGVGLWVADGGTGAPFDIRSVPRLQDAHWRDAVPSPDFGTMAVLLTHYRRDTLPDTVVSRVVHQVLFLDLESRSIRDSVEFDRAPHDTGERLDHGLAWESDSSLMVYGTRYGGSHGWAGYRIRGGEVVDTLQEVGCVGRKTSSSPFDRNGLQLFRGDSLYVSQTRNVTGCAGWRPAGP